MRIRNTGLVAKLGRVLVLQVALISVTVAAGIYVTNTIVQDSLVNEAVENEAAHFGIYTNKIRNGASNTANMLGYQRLMANGNCAGQFHDYAPGLVEYSLAMPSRYCTSPSSIKRACT